MAGQSWLVDSNRIATKIRSASGAVDPQEIQWKSNPTKSCPNCHYVMDNSDAPHTWPGLPRGVKFDPTDQEIIWHLLAKVGIQDFKPHPFIDEFVPTVEEEGGICYTHPQNLPGVKQDGSVSHFFHRAIKAYSTGTRKRRKIHGDDCGDVRWHKTGRTKPVLLDGVQKGCKKIMVLYISPVRGGKAEKTNWVMHQYHLGTGEDEKEGEYVISKIFYQQQQQQQTRQIERAEEEISEAAPQTMTPKVDPVTPKSVTPEPCVERRFSNHEVLQDSTAPLTFEHEGNIMIDEIETPFAQTYDQHHNDVENQTDEAVAETSEEEDAEESKWWENESQFLLSSQQLVEGLSLCDEFLQSQSPGRDENGDGQGQKGKALLREYAHLGPEDLKRDLEECQNMATDPANIELDTPPDFRLSQLEFGSQDSYIAWGESFRGGKVID
ncbi:SUPPRESSOR OF GAMMA RESPONSE 1 isoform X2 [Salvia miltiorrhiza]|uniref:SUPPRESSOR OF GAMMA RESPONSE 1 isoform X2 n=1 Tax=Salvia miltiorrhiza TaxID=226208 RepID=UPI0025ACE6F5|nr:SUPPRESSOR OF GAMMA RESPONSE 1 isoform X2 [Salvia miltiorrhiza]